jgi:3D (Asp-Asp-Asp) domain-containing protein
VGWASRTARFYFTNLKSAVRALKRNYQPSKLKLKNLTQGRKFMSCSIGSSYIIKSGDTLYNIAQQQLGDGNRWREIKKPDGSSVTDSDANNLQEGQEICLLKNGPSPGRKLNMEATFYSREETQGHTPSSGIHGKTMREALAGLGRMQCAVDPTVIPMLTEFTVILWDGQQVPAKALDVGTAIKGNIIDLFVDTVNEAINFGRKPVTVVL